MLRVHLSFHSIRALHPPTHSSDSAVFTFCTHRVTFVASLLYICVLLSYFKLAGASHIGNYKGTPHSQHCGFGHLLNRKGETRRQRSMTVHPIDTADSTVGTTPTLLHPFFKCFTAANAYSALLFRIKDRGGGSTSQSSATRTTECAIVASRCAKWHRSSPFLLFPTSVGNYLFAPTFRKGPSCRLSDSARDCQTRISYTECAWPCVYPSRRTCTEQLSTSKDRGVSGRASALSSAVTAPSATAPPSAAPVAAASESARCPNRCCCIFERDWTIDNAYVGAREFKCGGTTSFCATITLTGAARQAATPVAVAFRAYRNPGRCCCVSESNGTVDDTDVAARAGMYGGATSSFAVITPLAAGPPAGAPVAACRASRHLNRFFCIPKETWTTEDAHICARASVCCGKTSVREKIDARQQQNDRHKDSLLHRLEEVPGHPQRRYQHPRNQSLPTQDKYAQQRDKANFGIVKQKLTLFLVYSGTRKRIFKSPTNSGCLSPEKENSAVLTLSQWPLAHCSTTTVLHATQTAATREQRSGKRERRPETGRRDSNSEGRRRAYLLALSPAAAAAATETAAAAATAAPAAAAPAAEACPYNLSRVRAAGVGGRRVQEDKDEEEQVDEVKKDNRTNKITSAKTFLFRRTPREKEQRHITQAAEQLGKIVRRTTLLKVRGGKNGGDEDRATATLRTGRVDEVFEDEFAETEAAEREVTPVRKTTAPAAAAARHAKEEMLLQPRVWREALNRLGIGINEIQETLVKGSGAGGQKINKASTCVVLVHRPSQTVVRCQYTRSQRRNRASARAVLLSKLQQQKAAEEQQRQHLLHLQRHATRQPTEEEKRKGRVEKQRRSEIKAERRANMGSLAAADVD